MRAHRSQHRTRRLAVASVVLGGFVVVGVGCVDGLSASESAPCTSSQDCLAFQVCGEDGLCDGAYGSDAGYSADVSGDVSAEANTWQQWGTSGSVERAEDGAFCHAGDVRTSDLGDLYIASSPPGPWPEEARPDIVAHCGDDYETFAWRLANCERLTRDLPPLECDLRLVWLARGYAQDMDTQDYFGHVDPQGNDIADRLIANGIHFTVAGENLALFSSVEAAHVEWMASPTHRANILAPQYDRGGVGIVRADERYMLTSVFMSD